METWRIHWEGSENNIDTVRFEPERSKNPQDLHFHQDKSREMKSKAKENSRSRRSIRKSPPAHLLSGSFGLHFFSVCLLKTLPNFGQQSNIAKSNTNLEMYNQTGGASTKQIGEAVKVRNEHRRGSPTRQEANKIVHSQDPGTKNKYTTNNYGHSSAAQSFLQKNSK
jgi:hypothetical protein